MNSEPPVDAGMLPGDQPATPKPEPMQPGEVCAPTAALAEPTDTEEMVSPEPGDIINGQFEGKVTRVAGDQTYFIPTSVNGKELGAKEGEQDEVSPEQQDASDLASLEGQASQMDQGGGY